MITEILMLHLSSHGWMTASELMEDISLSESTGSRLYKLAYEGRIHMKGTRPKYFKSDEIRVDDEVYDEYIYRVIAKGDVRTLSDIEAITYLTSYRISKSLKRLRMTGRIKTKTGQGICLTSDARITSPSKEWTTTEVNSLIVNAGTMSVTNLCELFGRTKNSIYNKASEMGISLLTNTCKRGHILHQREHGRRVCNVCRKIEKY